MPFTIGGDYIPPEEKPEKKSGKPVKVRLEKRKKAILTVVLNLERPDLKEIASKIKAKLGCGGSVKDGRIELQGEKVEPVKKLLLEMGIKVLLTALIVTGLACSLDPIRIVIVGFGLLYRREQCT